MLKIASTLSKRIFACKNAHNPTALLSKNFLRYIHQIFFIKFSSIFLTNVLICSFLYSHTSVLEIVLQIFFYIRIRYIPKISKHLLRIYYSWHDLVRPRSYMTLLFWRNNFTKFSNQINLGILIFWSNVLLNCFLSLLFNYLCLFYL
jgi:hypothetical protein